MKSDNKVNAEAKREEAERKKAEAFYDDEWETGCTMLFPDEISGGTVSATGSTGLIQIIPTTPEEYESYEQINSFRQKMPIKEKDSD